MTHQTTDGSEAGRRLDPRTKHKTTSERNARGTGSTYQVFKNNRVQWCASISVMEETENGIKRRYIRGFGDTEALAVRARSMAISKRMKGEATGTGDRSPKISTVLEQWLDPSNGKKLSEESRRKYRNDINRHVIEVIGNSMLHTLDKKKLTKLFHETLPESGVGTSAIYHVFINFNTMLNWCVKEEIIEKNPMDTVERVEKSNASATRDRELINQRTNLFLRLLEKLEQPDHPYHEHHLIFLFMSLGLRRAELLGLEWDKSVKNLNKKNQCYLIIKQQLGFITGQGFHIKPHTKNMKERRVYLPESFRKALNEHKREQVENGSSGRGEWSELVFTDQNRYITYAGYSRIWMSTWRHYLGDKFKELYFRPHYVRHIAGSILLAKTNGNITIVQDILGHSEAMMSFHYSHQMEETRQDAARALESGLKVQRKNGAPMNIPVR